MSSLRSPIHCARIISFILLCFVRDNNVIHNIIDLCTMLALLENPSPVIKLLRFYLSSLLRACVINISLLDTKKINSQIFENLMIVYDYLSLSVFLYANF